MFFFAGVQIYEWRNMSAFTSWKIFLRLFFSVCFVVVFSKQKFFFFFHKYAFCYRIENVRSAGILKSCHILKILDFWRLVCLWVCLWNRFLFCFVCWYLYVVSCCCTCQTWLPLKHRQLDESLLKSITQFLKKTDPDVATLGESVFFSRKTPEFDSPRLTSI